MNRRPPVIARIWQTRKPSVSQSLSYNHLNLDIDGKISTNPLAMVAISQGVTFGNDKPPTTTDSRGHLAESDCKLPKSGFSDKNLMSSVRFAVLKWMYRFRKLLQ